MWHGFDSRASCLDAMARSIAGTLIGAVAARGRAGLAVSGGRSPAALFDALSQADVPWGQVEVTLVDERFVPPDAPDSNERLVRSHLLKGKAAAARFTGLVSHPASLPRSLAQANLQTGDLSLVILGMGDDGHTASLFPGAPQLAQALDPSRTARYIQVSPPDAPHERISMTLAAILSAGRIMLNISGRAKRDIFEQAARRITPDLPISYIIHQHGVPFDVYWHP